MRSLMAKNQGKFNRAITILILFLGLGQGLLFIFLIPPWQHYDEPGNFEYAWLAANLDHWPKAGEYNAEMRLEVAASMMENGFYRGLDYLPSLLSTNPPVSIGISQTGDVPVYYFLASIPLRLFKFTDITFQLLTARFVSLLLLILTIGAALGVSADLFGEHHPLRWVIPLFLVFLPPFTDLMTAVNNDVAAIAFASLMLWGSTRIILKGLTLRRFLWVAAASAAALLGKSTGLMAVPLLILVLLIGVYNLNPRRILIYGYVILGLASIGLIFSWHNTSPAFFYAKRQSQLPVRINSNIAPIGHAIFSLPSQNSIYPAFSQFLPPSNITTLAGKTVTLGVWMWSDHPSEIRFPELVIDNSIADKNRLVQLTTQPMFYSFPTKIPEQSRLGWMLVYPISGDGTIHAFWDGWVMIEGDFSTSAPPIFLDPQASQGTWNGVSFNNLIRNASGEKFWPELISPISNLVYNHYNLSPSFLWSLFDVQGAGWYFQKDLSWIFQTFWAKFGWAHISLIGQQFFWIFDILSILSLLGVILAGWLYRKKLPWILIFFLTIDLFGTLIITLLRGSGSWMTGLLLPAARYAYPAIIPIALFLCIGWYFLYIQLFHRLHYSPQIFLVCFLAAMIGYDILAVLSITLFYGINL